MYFDKLTSQKLVPLLDKDVEDAFLLFLSTIEAIELQHLTNPELSEVKIRQVQGKYSLIQELKQYRQRIIDSNDNG